MIRNGETGAVLFGDIRCGFGVIVEALIFDGSTYGESHEEGQQSEEGGEMMAEAGGCLLIGDITDGGAGDGGVFHNVVMLSFRQSYRPPRLHAGEYSIQSIYCKW